MDKIRQFAHDALTSKVVKLVIGYENGTANKPRPVFISRPEDCNRLIFNEKCKMNLSVYLKNHKINADHKAAIFATLPAVRSVLQLASEKQLEEDSLVVVYVKNSIEGNIEMEVTNNFKELEAIVSREDLSIDAEKAKLIKEILSWPPEKRFEYWVEQFSSCIKCYACRAACPLCYCTRCTTEINQPQWVHVPSHTLGNLEWHIMRAMHMAGRCTNCNACNEACPLDIPLNLLTKYLIQETKEKFGDYTFTLDKKNTLSSFKPDDKENFIR